MGDDGVLLVAAVGVGETDPQGDAQQGDAQPEWGVERVEGAEEDQV